jgi:hypothetical protein
MRGASREGIHGEVGETRPLPKEDIGEKVVSTNVVFDGVMEAPGRWFCRFWNEELTTD